jgi:hypothetical protein
VLYFLQRELEGMGLQKNTKGYTIVELLIVTATSAVIAMSAFTLISGQQAKNEFQQSVRDFESKITDLANDVSKGYFPNKPSYALCEADSSGIKYSNIETVDLGASSDCLFGGKALQLGPAQNGKVINAHTLAVRRTIRGDPKMQVNSLGDLDDNDIKVACEENCSTEVIEQVPLQYALEVVSVRHESQNVEGIVFLSSFGKTSSDIGGEQTGAPITNLYMITNSASGSTFSDKLAKPTNYQRPTSSVKICAKQGGSGGRSVLFTIGKNGRELSLTTEIDVVCT